MLGNGSAGPASVAPERGWRLLRSGDAEGARNMALDEAIFEQVASGGCPPTLRLYGWQPPAVSLGRFQELDGSLDLAEIERRGYGLVRRPTGGRAILHDDELTYLVAVREQDLEQGGTLHGSYRQISRGLEAGLALLGLPSAMGTERVGPVADRSLAAVCFAKAARCDLTSAGRKVVGSAQMRAKGAILQHGSIPLHLRSEDVLAVMPGPAGDAGLLRRRAAGIADVLGRDVSREELAEAVIAGFAQALGLSLVPGSLTPTEDQRASELVATKYGTPAWTQDGLPPSP